jgi:periplasmic protein TonB
MLETALLSSRSPARAHAVRLSLPAVVALHGAVAFAFVAASVWNSGEPPEPAIPIVFGRLASPPPPRGDGGPPPQDHAAHAPHTAISRMPVERIESIPDVSPPGESPAEVSTATDGPDSGDGQGTLPGARDGVDGGIGDGRADLGESVGDPPLTPGGEVAYPMLVHRVEPDYPDAARRARIEGVVILDAIITASGEVEEVRLLKSASPILDDAAMRAVRRWSYRPATLNGRAVRVRLTVTVNFFLRGA